MKFRKQNPKLTTPTSEVAETVSVSPTSKPVPLQSVKGLGSSTDSFTYSMALAETVSAIEAINAIVVFRESTASGAGTGWQALPRERRAGDGEDIEGGDGFRLAIV